MSVGARVVVVVETALQLTAVLAVAVAHTRSDKSLLPRGKPYHFQSDKVEPQAPLLPMQLLELAELPGSLPTVSRGLSLLAVPVVGLLLLVEFHTLAAWVAPPRRALVKRHFQAVRVRQAVTKQTVAAVTAVHLLAPQLMDCRVQTRGQRRPSQLAACQPVPRRAVTVAQHLLEPQPMGQ